MSIGNSGRDLLLSILLLPILEFLSTSKYIVGRPPNMQRGVVVAISFLALFASIKIGLEIVHKEPSYYDMLDVLPTAASADLKKGYKRASLEVHPDKLKAKANQAGEAADDEANDEAFIALKAAYEVLSNTQTREVYDKFGKAGVESKDDVTSLLAGLGFFYVVWLALAFLLTRRKTVSRAQTWSFTGLVALGIFEYQACILNFDFLQEQLPQLAMFEKVELLHRLYPVFLLGSRLVAFLFFQDIDAHNFIMLQHLHWKMDQLRDRLSLLGQRAQYPPGAIPYVPQEQWMTFAQETQELYRKVQEIQQTGGAAPGTVLRRRIDGATNPTAAAPEANSSADASATPPVSPPMAPPMTPNAPPMPAGQQQPKAARGGGRQLGGLVWFFGVYFFFQWLLGRGSS